jgi:polyisoprenoid-binding protein YceI
MKKYLLPITVLCFVLVYAGGIAQTVKYNVSEETTMTVSGTYTLHDWTSEVNEVKGFVEVDEKFANSGKIKKGDKIELVNINVPVTSIISPRGATMDKKTYAALKSEENPEIIFVLKDSKVASVNGEVFAVDATGDLTVAGVTKKVEFPVEGKLLGEGKMSFSGSYKLNMVEYEMEPPSAMFGQIVTGEEVEIKFELIVNK